MIDAVEYYHAGLDHYFVTAAPGEIAKLDAAALPGWQRTNLAFKAFDPAANVPGVSPVCRFYGKPEAGLDSHFYSASPAECAQVRLRYGDSWCYGLTRAFSYNEYWDFREYDPVADRIIADYPVDLLPADRYYFSANDARCIVGREIVFFNGIERTWFAFHMDSKTWRALPWQALTPVPGAGDFSMVYVPPLDKIVATQGWGELYQIDPATGVVSAFPVQGSARFGSNLNNGLYGRLNYQDGMLFAIDWATSDVKVMRVQ